MVDDLAGRLLAAVDSHGMLLMHDRVLPSITAIATGGPVGGSWWSHPLANRIYNALGEIEDDVLRVKLVAGKDTLVARRLWAEVAGVGAAREAWQLCDLGDGALTLLHDVEQSRDEIVPLAGQREPARTLARRLLVVAGDVHTPAGHHVTAYESWTRWTAARSVTTGDAVAARATVEAVVGAWPRAGRRRLLPW